MSRRMIAFCCSVLFLVSAHAQDRLLFAYVGTGIKDPVLELADMYENATGVKVEMTFNNSGSLVTQLSVAKKGDLFLPGSVAFVRKAETLGLIAQVSAPLGFHVPVIIVPKTNPGKIAGIEDFARSGVRLVLPDRDATALGKSIFQVFGKLGMVKQAESNVLAYMETPQKVVTALGLGQGDAGIVDFSAVSKQLDRFQVIEIDPKVNVVEELPCAVLSCGGKQDEALRFMRFAEKEGPSVFAKHGFKTNR